jgi:hypothetical protein
MDEHGDLRTLVLLSITLATVAILGVGTYAALLWSNVASPGILAIWVTAALVLIKLPLLALVWWILGRRREFDRGGGWSSRECAEILDYLEVQARDSVGRPDAATRLAYFAEEAWFVADSATDADTPAAVETAVTIDSLAAAAGAAPARRTARPPGPAPA